MTHVVTRWWWVRHAPVIGVNGRIYGQDDLEADCSDTARFAALAGFLPPEAVWVASHLRRTHQTMAAIRAALHLPEIAEQHFGDWQGLTYAELEARRDGAYHRFWHAPAIERPPNGESFADVVSRVERAVTRLSADHAGRDIIAVAHGGTIRAALAAALGLDPERALGFNVDTLSVTRLDLIDGPGEGAQWRIHCVNRTAS
jgi:alpha-ribazole phosphatase